MEFITGHFVPVRVHVRQQPEKFKDLGARYSASWTPTILVIDEDGHARHRIEGFLPVDDYLSQLSLGLAHAAFARGEFEPASGLQPSAVMTLSASGPASGAAAQRRARGRGSA